ncbi:replication endonuclease [Aliarcobacter butzleri]|uniref:replication endonuclease n=1 Tax=Aliarcobacter butzleri TaxID=28197 RepID=UPI001EDAAE51|nr:replication endonuclease [Aliarcobacter butzleri]MCG3685996.1 replication endonuclease [Aliarcobacter butzleri]
MFGIDIEDKNFIDNKLEKQKNFLKEFVIDLGDKEFNLLDNVYSANLNPKKYFSEINNRVNSINKYAKNMGLMPVFITLTAPSRFHPIKTINQKKRLFENNPNYVYDNNFKSAVKDSATLLSDLWHKFTSLQVVRKMKKATGQGLIYFRVFEPHKTGIPHVHALVYIPKDWILPIKKNFYQYFRSFGIKQLQFKYTWYNSKGGAIGYMMKYITKTFKNAETNIMDDACYWYIKHRIIRFCSSRSLCSLHLYRKIRYFFKDDFEDDYIFISNLFRTGDISYYFNKTMITYKYYNPDEDEHEITLYSKKFIPNLSHKKHIIAYLDNNSKKRYKEILIDKPKITFKYHKKIEVENKNIPLIIDNKKFTLLNDNRIVRNYPNISYFRDFELLSYYNTYDIDVDSIQHYGLIKKELINRNLINDDNFNINDYRNSFDF